MNSTRPLFQFPPLSPADRRVLLILGLILLLGGGLRFAGLGWSLPDARHPLATYHPDELINLNAARAADLLHGQFDIGFYNYGAFYFYLVSFAQMLGRGWGLIPSLPPGVGPLSPQEASEASALFLAGRIVTALLGTATIPLLSFTGRKLYSSKAGLIAAGLYAAAPLAVIHAHFLTVDVPATFFVTLALFFSARILALRPAAGPEETPSLSAPPRAPVSLRPYALAGIAVGLASATKYTAVTVLAAPLAAHFWRTKRLEGESSFKPLFLLLGTALLAFLLGCPGVFLNSDAFWNGLPNFPGSGLRYELFEHSRQGHGAVFTQTGSGWVYHLWVSLRFGLGFPLWGVTLFALFFAVKRREHEDKMLLVFLGTAYLLTGLSAVRFARYLIPLYPAFFLLVGKLISDLKGNAPMRFSPSPAPVLTGLLIAGTLGSTLTFLISMTKQDARDLAADFIEQNLKGKTIAFAKIPWFYSPPLSPYLGAPAAPVRAKIVQSAEYRFRLPFSEWSLEVLSPVPDAVLLSNFETMHEETRLHLPGPTQFVEEVRRNFNPVVFGTQEEQVTRWAGGAIFGQEKVIPEDLLYVVPKIEVFLRK